MTETFDKNSFQCIIEECEETITIDEAEEGDGIVIEFSNFLPPYTEWYTWCEQHRPDEERLDEIGKRIKEGSHGFEPSHMEEHPWPGEQNVD